MKINAKHLILLLMYLETKSNRTKTEGQKELIEMIESSCPEFKEHHKAYVQYYIDILEKYI